MTEDVTIKLSHDEFDTLKIALGHAIGAAHGKDRRLFYSFVMLSNAVNRDNPDNPDFVPYEIPELVTQ